MTQQTAAKTFILVLLIFSSCENQVRFEVPQPEGLKNEKAIPKRFLGSYLSMKDSSIVVITRDQIIRFMKYDYSGPLTELDSADRANIKGDTSYSEIELPVRVDITIKGDSLFQHVDYHDTLFSLTSEDVLRKLKGYYFLNNEAGVNRWNVTKLE